jgi:hypothetical protein
LTIYTERIRSFRSHVLGVVNSSRLSDLSSPRSNEITLCRGIEAAEGLLQSAGLRDMGSYSMTMLLTGLVPEVLGFVILMAFLRVALKGP